jgi:hypothetical protein
MNCVSEGRWQQSARRQPGSTSIGSVVSYRPAVTIPGPLMSARGDQTRPCRSPTGHPPRRISLSSPSLAGLVSASAAPKTLCVSPVGPFPDPGHGRFNLKIAAPLDPSGPRNREYPRSIAGVCHEMKNQCRKMESPVGRESLFGIGTARVSPVIAIPLVIVAASIGASLYMAFGWRP